MGDGAGPLIRPLRGHLLPRGEEFASVGVSLFSPAGRRWPEGPDEGAGTEKRERAFCTVRRHD
ncbi:MAG: hypothetical protein EOS78_24205 [Mesorhizobium sp.]|nr:MAG: hypothetical protein EOS78_24205 [Mesorhizobium sp.]